MNFVKTLTACAGLAALALTGCSDTSSNSDSGSGDATENAAVGVDYSVSLSCDDTVKAPTVATKGSAMKFAFSDDVTSIDVLAIGARGADGAHGGHGGAVTATIPVQPAWKKSVFAKVGCYGDGSYKTSEGGGWPNGGGLSGHGGGGSTSLETNADSFSPIVVAGGGGGTGV